MKLVNIMHFIVCPVKLLSERFRAEKRKLFLTSCLIVLLELTA